MICILVSGRESNGGAGANVWICLAPHADTAPTADGSHLPGNAARVAGSGRPTSRAIVDASRSWRGTAAAIPIAMKSISIDQLQAVTGGAAKKLPKLSRLPKLGTKPKFDPDV